MDCLDCKQHGMDCICKCVKCYLVYKYCECKNQCYFCKDFNVETYGDCDCCHKPYCEKCDDNWSNDKEFNITYYSIIDPQSQLDFCYECIMQTKNPKIKRK